MKGPMASNPTAEMFPADMAKRMATPETQTRAARVANGLGAVRPQAAQPGRSLLVSLFGHGPGRVLGRGLVVLNATSSRASDSPSRGNATVFLGFRSVLSPHVKAWVPPCKPWETCVTDVLIGRTSENPDQNYRCMTSGIALPWPHW